MKTATTYCTNFLTRVSVLSVCKTLLRILPCRETVRLRTALNATNAVIRKTGIFLYENGNVGTVQHVDMAAYAAQA